MFLKYSHVVENYIDTYTYNLFIFVICRANYAKVQWCILYEYTGDKLQINNRYCDEPVPLEPHIYSNGFQATVCDLK